jgi:hypothetical protein
MVMRSNVPQGGILRQRVAVMPPRALNAARLRPSLGRHHPRKQVDPVDGAPEFDDAPRYRVLAFAMTTKARGSPA